MTPGETSDERPRSKSFVLRLWPVESDGQVVWRASLRDARSGQRRGFADLAALAVFLAEQTAGLVSAGNSTDPA